MKPKAEYNLRSCQGHIYYSALGSGLCNAWSRVYFKIMLVAHILLSLKLWIIYCLKQSVLQDNVRGTDVIQILGIECLRQSVLQDLFCLEPHLEFWKVCFIILLGFHFYYSRWVIVAQYHNLGFIISVIYIFLKIIEMFKKKITHIFRTS